ncbi:MliC family protein [Phyllobacterium myrsinacearum]|uniref:Membrane-bound inhibitor of C-type lysozyme n=1 Tax=Phyllobacterium myrsinacearum TaxID=28101 RepID=A0A839EH53_9HYPH|nr:MliC family protein [Phyllobacterium myrsinacearum]MBA8878222.1 membrane-bound inhibitor of C-type lysozyme [Phyllobacterium myrsinacearum]
MKKLFVSLAFTCALLPALPAMAAEQAAEDRIEQSTYQCERGVIVDATYINTKGGSSFAVINVENKLVPMRASQSGSGALYIAIDQADSYRWHTKGDAAVLSYLDATPGAQEKTLLSECKASDAEE